MFDQFDFGDLNFFMNSGSYFLFLAIIVVMKTSGFIFNKLATVFARRRVVRKVAMVFYSRNYMLDWWQSTLKLLIESYFDISICSLLNLYAFWLVKDDAVEIASFFEEDNLFCSIVSIFHTLILVLTPIVGYYVMKKQNPNSRDKWLVFYRDHRNDTLMRALFTVFFLWRRLITAMILIFMEQLPFFQMTFLTIFSFANMWYLIDTDPLPSKSATRSEIFNELSIYLICLISTNFLNVAIPVGLKDTLGYIVIAMASTSMLINVGAVAKNSLMLLFDVVYDTFWNFKTNKKIMRLFELRKKLVQ